jgi:hypothetical protein
LQLAHYANAITYGLGWAPNAVKIVAVMPSTVFVFTGNGMVDDVAEESLSNSDAAVADFG